jgi:CYTH domain-containing protein
VTESLDRALTRFGADGSWSKRASGSTRRALRRQLDRHGDDLLQKLAAVLDIDSAGEAHDARISVKRLRYLIEPFAAELPNADDVIRRLESLQDLLGELHDRHRAGELLAEAMRDATRAGTEQEIEELLPGVASAVPEPTDFSAARARSGLVALARQVRAEARDCFATLKADWLQGRARPLVDQATALLESAAEATSTEEIERKYLLSTLPDRALETEPSEITQGWLPGTKLLERVRHVRTDRGDEWYRTVKSGGGMRRVEIEEATSQQVFDSLWPLTEGRRVQKRRYPVKENGSTWEIDEFTDRNLVIAEVELEDVDSEVSVPSWLQQYVLREVTDEPGYLNYNLAR